MNYQDITIKELTQWVMINCNTFYLHYSSIDALLRELQDEIAGEFIEKQVSYTKIADIHLMFGYFLNTWPNRPLSKIDCCATAVTSSS